MIFSENRYPLFGIMLYFYCVTNVSVSVLVSERHSMDIVADCG